jgi:hypothetical protein
MEEHHIQLQILYDNLYHYGIKSKDRCFYVLKVLLKYQSLLVGYEERIWNPRWLMQSVSKSEND